MSYSADKAWYRWLTECSIVHQNYSAAMDNDDSFAYTERCSVSVLIAGAERAGLISLSEYVWHKRGAKGDTPRHRPDLYIYDPDSEEDWGFEFKQAWHTLKNIYDEIDKAKEDAARLPDDCGTPCYGVIVSLYQPRLEDRREIIDALYGDLKRSEVFMYEFGQGYNPGCAVAILGLLSDA